MAHTTKSPSARSSTKASAVVRRRTSPRGRLAGAVLLVFFGSFLPWIDTALGSVSGARGAGLWTFYAAMLGLAAVLVPWPRWRRVAVIQAGIQAGILALVAIALPAWQVIHLITIVGFGGWIPGPGIVIVFGGGVLAASCAWQLAKEPVDADH